MTGSGYLDFGRLQARYPELALILRQAKPHTSKAKIMVWVA